MQNMEQRLDSFVYGRASSNLTVVYSDMHWLWGGVTITVSTNGAYERLEHQRASIVPSLVHTTITTERIRQVVVLLRELRAWEQQILEPSQCAMKFAQR